MYTEEIRISVIPGAMCNIINISQYDVGVRSFHFIPYTTEGDLAYQAGCAVTLEATKPDRSAIIHNCTYNSDGSVDYTLQEQLAAVAGRVWSKLVLRDTLGGILGTAAIVWVVDRAGVTDGAEMSDSDISAVQEFVQEFGSINAYGAALHGLMAAYGGPLTANAAAGMTDQTKVYVYTGTTTSALTKGHWYYYDGSSWADGGVYQAAAVETDKTLTVSNTAADAKVTGDKITELKNDLSKDVVQIADEENDWGMFALSVPSQSGMIYYNPNTTRISMIKRIPVTPGNTITITCVPGMQYRAIFFTTSGDNASGAGYNPILDYNDDPRVWHTDAIRMIIVPADAVGICVCAAYTDSAEITTAAYTGIGIQVTTIYSRLQDAEREIATVQEDITEIPAIINDRIYTGTGKISLAEESTWANGYVNPSGNEIVSSQTRCYDTVQHLISDTYTGADKYITIMCPDGKKIRVTFWSDDAISGSALIPTPSNTVWTEGAFTVQAPDAAKMYMVSVANSDNSNITPEDCEDISVEISIENKVIDSEYKNKKLSILGDSISTFAGADAQSAGDSHTIADGEYTYPGNHCRYPNAYLTEVSQTYWMELITRLGMELGINESWAGSCVSWDGSETSDAGADIYIASPTRIGHLGENGAPDYILVNAGTNDIGLSKPIGTFNTESPVSYTEEQIAALPVDTFADAYRAMLIRLQKQYPLARIIVMLPDYTTSYYNPTRADLYLEVIKEACDYFGVPYVDMRTTGITMYNTATYMGDGIHPNAKGMDLLYKKIIKAFLYKA